MRIKIALIIVVFGLLLTGAIYFAVPQAFKSVYNKPGMATVLGAEQQNVVLGTQEQKQPDANTAPVQPVVPVAHIPTPSAVKAIYMTEYVAGDAPLREKLLKIVDTTEINTIVIDVKDATGKIAFQTNDPALTASGATSKNIRDIDGVISELHQKNIYVIARIEVFQDPYMVQAKPDWALKSISSGTPWKDTKGLTYLDPSNHAVWDYTIAVAKEAYARGFDEINFDYIRFPSDGAIHDIAYPGEGTTTRAEIIKSFFEYLDASMKSAGITHSADIFGLTTVAQGDLGIGQVLENALPYFDYVSPMVYPSHFANGTDGFKNPADHPYDIIKWSMDQAVVRAKAINISAEKLRPWLQDFSIGAVYDAQKVDDQIKATYDSGLTSWMLWNASNKYTTGALKVD